MESTGTFRKPLAECTPPQKRANSLPANIIPKKLVKVQHFPSKLYISLSRNNIFSALGKTEFNENRKGCIQQRCVLCQAQNIRKQTIHFCRTCADAPALCYPECFDLYHSKL